MTTQRKHFLQWKPCLLLLTMIVAVSGCASESASSKPSWQIYQTDFLHLAPETEVQTTQGIYKTQTSETWVSEKKYRDLEKEILRKN